MVVLLRLSVLLRKIYTRLLYNSWLYYCFCYDYSYLIILNASCRWADGPRSWQEDWSLPGVEPPVRFATEHTATALCPLAISLDNQHFLYPSFLSTVRAHALSRIPDKASLRKRCGETEKSFLGIICPIPLSFNSYGSQH